MDFDPGCRPSHGPGVDYEGGILHNSARVVLHAAHPPGAVAYNDLVAVAPTSMINLQKVAWRAN
jgi:hypothetical protein